MAARRARQARAVAVLSALVITAVLAFGAGWNAHSLYRARPDAVPGGAASAASLNLADAIGSRGCPRPKKITALATERRAVALTFDDGPSVDTTRPILRVLDEKGVKATFFETGEHTAAHPELVAEVAAAGHALGSHSWSHPHLPQVPVAQVRDEVRRSTQAVSVAAGQPICLSRPPFGQTDGDVDTVMSGEGLTTVMWTQNPQDWTNPKPAELRARSGPRPGNPPTILLLHEHGSEDPQQVGPSATVAALPQIIDDYLARGYEFVRVDGRPFDTADSRSRVADGVPARTADGR